MMAKNKRYIEILKWIWLVACFSALVISVACWLPSMVDSDMASEMVLAKLIQEEGHFVFTNNWFYSTEIRVLYIQIIYSILFRFTSNWYVVRVIGNAIIYLIMIFSLYYMCKQDCELKKLFPIIGGIILLPLSRDYYQIVLYTESYAPFISISFILIGIALSVSKSNGSLIKNKELYIGGLVALCSGLNGMRQLMVLFFPALLTAIVMYLYPRTYKRMNNNSVVAEEDNRQKARFLSVVFVLSFCAIVGFVINDKVLSKYFVFRKYNFMSWKHIKLETISEIIDGLFSSLGWAYGSVFSISSVINIGLSLMIIFLFIQYRSLLKRNITMSYDNKVICVYFIISLVLFSLIILFTDMHYIARHNLPIVVFLYPVLFILSINIENNKIRRTIQVLFICLALIQGCYQYYTYGNLAKKGNDRESVAKYLVEHNYTEGYASFWNANVLTELSGGKIEVWNYGDSAITSFGDLHPWLQRKDHLVRKPDGRLFVLTTNEEIENFPILKLLDKNKTVTEIGEYLILEYNNIGEMPEELLECHY